MVATVLRLRYRLLANMLTRSPWQLVGFVFGIIGALSGLFVVVAALFLIGVSGVDATHSVVTLGGALLVVGWSIAPCSREASTRPSRPSSSRRSRSARAR
ncbi:hypothetical protein [Homoserinibacter gongjuensis]|uniref:Uncharacterized protein n=1 Tax=Homoserinibacter gongjuensis TaxID=1162968 RepID=A0ABQ6JPF2_9MICO|nr:hypothetical protein [Homoserinibacter gongjuensis]GMA90177.1 hypothetical protein GCM10025869_07060 [Homoserinibacter gongjuensis]